MSRFNELLEKRKNLTANIYEEEDLIELAKRMTDEELIQVDKSLLTYSNGERLASLNKAMNNLLKKLNEKKGERNE